MATSGVELATAYVSLTVDGSRIGPGVRRSLGGVEAQADRVGKASGRKMGDGISKGIVSSVGRIAGPLAAIFATVGIGKFISGTVDEAREAQKVSAVTDSIVKSTGGAAKVTAKQVGDLSTAISNKIGVDDEAIQASANLLLTFKNVRNEVGKGNKVFDTAVGLAQDLSKAGFGSAEGAAKMLGKALNDPVKGITALGRAGVTFSDAQKKQIKDAVKNNDLLSAQRIILGEVKSQVGGVAEAAATTGEKVGVAFGNLKEKIGTALLPVLDRVGNWFLQTGLPKIEKFGKGVKGLFDLFTKGDYTGALNEAFGWAEDSGQVDFLFKVRDGLIAIKDGAMEARRWFMEELWPALKDGWETIQPGLERAKQIIGDAFGGGNGDTVKNFALFVTDKLIPGIATLANVWLPIAATQFAATVEAVKGLYNIFVTLRDFQVKVASAIIGTFIRVMNVGADMLDALSNVPGFGWAKTAADKMRKLSGTAAGVKAAIDRIPDSKNIKITAQVSMPGRITLPGGEKINVGQRATGGPVRKGQPYIVGEKRPELFVPNTSGKILPRVPESGGGAVDSTVRDAQFARMIANELKYVNLAVGVSEVDQSLAKRRRGNALSSPGR